MEQRSIRCLAGLVLVLVPALAAPAASAQGQVWVVDADGLPGFDFTDVQPAVNAAADGDVVLVRGRFGKSYGGFTVRGKSLVVAGELDASTPFPVVAPPVVGPIRVRDVAAGQSVVLRGLVAEVAAPSLAPSLLVEDAPGRVLVEETTLLRTNTLPATPAVPSALRAVDADALVLVRSSAVGQDGAFGTLGGRGAFLADSRAFLHGATVEGGRGADATFVGPGSVLPASAGEAGTTLTGSFLFAAGSRIEGGDGGAGLVDAAFNCFPSADGGIGLGMFASTQAPAAVLQGAQLAGGAGGPAPGALCPAGEDGAPLVQLAGSVTTLASAPRSLRTTSPVREDEAVFLEVAGLPGDLVLLLVGAPGAPALSPAFDGALHLGAVGQVLSLGVLGSAPLELAFTVEELGPGVEFALLHLQTVHLAAGGGIVLGDPSVALLLDRAL